MTASARFSTLFAALLLASCEGGGGDPAPEPAPQADSPLSLSAPPVGPSNEETDPSAAAPVLPAPSESEAPETPSEPAADGDPEAEPVPLPEMTDPAPTEPTTPTEAPPPVSTPSRPEPEPEPPRPEPDVEPDTGPDVREPQPADASLPPEPDASPSATSALPSDCLIAEIPGATVCYTPGTRELLSVGDEEGTRWRFALPGDDATNVIRDVAYAQSRLVIVATTVSAAGDPGVELSTFTIGGAFLDTHPIEVPLQPSRQRVRAPSLEAVGTEEALFLSGELEATSNGGGDGPRVFLARFDVSTGAREAFRGWTEGGVPTVAPTDSRQIQVQRDGLAFEIDPRSLSASSSPLVNAGSYESVFAEARRHLEGEWIGQIDRVTRAVTAAVGPSGANVPVPCPSGGSVRRFTNMTGGVEATYDRCDIGPYVVDGTIRNENAVTNSSLTTIREYRAVSVTGNRFAFTEIVVDARVERGEFGAGRQACQGSGGRAIDVSLDRLVLRGAGRNVVVENGDYRQYLGQSGTYDPATRECEYTDSSTGSATMAVVGLFDEGRPWLVDFERSSAESARLTVTAADRSELEITGSLDGLARDEVVIRGADAVAPYRPSWRVGRIGDAWSSDR